MNFERYKTLWIAGIALGVVGLAVAFFAFRSRSTFNDAKERLQTAQTSLDRLRQEDPYPSAANVKVATESLSQLELFRASFLQSMSRNQFEPLDVEPAAFPLGPALSRLRSAARQSGVALKTEAFGFERYVADGVPASATNEVGRLSLQLQVIEHLCKVLFSGGILELLDVKRDAFEAPSAGGGEPADGGGRLRRAARVGVPVPVPTSEEAAIEEENRQFDEETVTVEFRCDPPVVWKVLNLLSADKSFIRVRDLQMQTEAPEQRESAAAPTAAPASAQGGLGPQGAEGTGPAAAAPPVPHKERILAGQEKVQVALTVEVYRFRMPEESASAGPATKGAP